MLFNKDNWNKLSKHKNGFIIVCGSPVYLLENDFVLHVRTSGKLATRLNNRDRNRELSRFSRLSAGLTE